MTDYNYRETNIFTGDLFGNGHGTSSSGRGARDVASDPPNEATRGHGSDIPHGERTTLVLGDHIELQRNSNSSFVSENGESPTRARAGTSPPQSRTPCHQDAQGTTVQESHQQARVAPLPQQEASGRRTRHKRPASGKKGKGALKVASLNMKGGGSTQTEYKWELINQLVRDEKIDVLALQETHMTNELRDRMNAKYGNRLHIVSSALDHAPNAAGVAIVLNKGTTPWKDISTEEVVNGRALQVKIPWCAEFTLQVLAVYAPNNTNDNAAFWETLRGSWDKGDTRPNLMLGDFNMVEDSVDRSPAHEDSLTQTQTLTNLKMRLRVADGWRRENPSKVDFSFRMEGRNILSRIDRIYIREDLLPFTNNWDIRRTGIRTDHSMVTMDIMNPWLPYQGEGRYAMPIFVLDQKDLLAKIQKLGLKHEENLMRAERARSDSDNPQTTHKAFKAEVIKCIRTYTKTLTPRITKRINSLKEDKERTLGNTHLESDERRLEASMIDEEIRELEMIKFGRTRDNIASKFFLEGETLGKTWIRASKEAKARDIIAGQKDIRSPGRRIVRKSKDMAEIMKTHHETIQTDGSPEANEDYEAHVNEVLSNLDKSLNPEQKEDLGTPLDDGDIKKALISLPNGKAAGLDGIVNELWKILSETYDRDHKPATPRFNVVGALTTVFRDIQEHGVCETTGFAEGWMCPLYKKGDRTEPSNYRPITVLNTDYKIFTKALSMKLTGVAASLIHSDQAGFMVGRRIEDQTELARLVIDWAELTETNGMIICLDQEKAYDKILHTFLWATLRKMNFPESFIKSVQAAYTGATTVVMVNGEMSTPFLVIRGVRQGNPLSCLLFNLAIESLAQMLRKSNLEGIRINDELERIITTLFADDTTVYLSENDSFQELEKILRSWCQASGGRFNVPKTVITPVGTTVFRRAIVETRTTRIPLAPIPDAIHIADEGEATRLLGAFIGNGVDNPGVWTPTREKITKELERWSRVNPTMNGRRLVANMVVGGLTQYRTCVQGMSKDTEEQLTTQMRKFVWNSDSTPPISTQTLTRPVEEGGKRLLDIKARNEAIDLMRLKRYLQTGMDRPAWAVIADEILKRVVTKGSRVTDEMAYINPFIQNIKINTRVGEKKLPVSLKKMVTTAKKHGVSFAPLLLSADLMGQMPIWFHPGLADRKRIQYNAAWAKCLRLNHRVRTVGDLIACCEAFGPEHDPLQECDCPGCGDCTNGGCLNPERCRAGGDRLLALLGNRWDPRLGARMRTLSEDELAAHPDEKTFDPDFTTRRSLAEGFRVFTTEGGRTFPANLEYPRKPVQHEGGAANTTVYTDGSSTNNGTVVARAGAGVWFGQGDARNQATRVPLKWEQTNNAGEALAIALAGKTADNGADLTIATDSKISMDGLTTHLQEWEDRGWLGIHNKELLQYTVGILRRRAGVTTLRKVKGHSGLVGNDAADELANEGARKEPQEEQLPMDVTGFVTEGTLLSGASQALLYRGIKENERTKERRFTVINLDRARWAVSASGGGPPTDRRIWKSLEDAALTREARAFLWRAMHGGYKLGEYWENINGYEDRAVCPKCRVQETMDHILTECEASGQGVIWRLVECLYNRRGVNWKRPTLGDILGCQMITPGTTSGDNKSASRRFNTIVMSESARVM